jgi:gliotoxin/aspirochlorine biosynthesis aminotransferase
MSERIEMQPKLSKRGWATVEGIMPKINDAVAEKLKKVNTNIDLSTAENWLLRPELVALCKDAVAQDLSARVRRFGE